MYIRGTLIKIATCLKREKAKQIVDTVEKIGALEIVHKKSFARATLADLSFERPTMFTCNS